MAANGEGQTIQTDKKNKQKTGLRLASESQKVEEANGYTGNTCTIVICTNR